MCRYVMSCYDYGSYGVGARASFAMARKGVLFSPLKSLPKETRKRSFSLKSEYDTFP